MEACILRNPSAFHVLSSLFFTLLLFNSITLTSSANTSTTSLTISKQFIKTSCNSTTYPRVCYKSLSSYASKVKTSPLKLANVALTVSLKAARNASSTITLLLERKGMTRMETSIVKDCVENFGDCIDELQQSLQEFKSLGGGKNVAFQMANIKTWVSAALTDEYTCSDGFEGQKVSSSLQQQIKNYISNVAKITSNALALINNLSVTDIKS
ncbi:pectinesterase inhibitor 4-like [Vitis riparia]|uniref:pectinesterase inhibitor 4-like n=1 Tax=Vitis riparia TaxID=96939 RepID=UPI00155A201E|nr:pectinesterase inhibitor 4-like [Vitis riparia]